MKNPKVDEFLKKTKSWPKEASLLREILLSCKLTEEFKWRLPCYAFEGSNVVLIQNFKNYCALLFFKGAILKDPKKVLIKMGENTEVGRQLRFTDTPQIEKSRSIIKALVKEAIRVEKEGLKVEVKKKIKLNEEFQKALNKNSKLKKAFEALTPGRQRQYNIHFSGAKKIETRIARIEKCIPKILKGQGLTDV